MVKEAPASTEYLVVLNLIMELENKILKFMKEIDEIIKNNDFTQKVNKVRDISAAIGPYEGAAKRYKETFSDLDDLRKNLNEIERICSVIAGFNLRLKQKNLGRNVNVFLGQIKAQLDFLSMELKSTKATIAAYSQ